MPFGAALFVIYPQYTFHPFVFFNLADTPVRPCYNGFRTGWEGLAMNETDKEQAAAEPEKLKQPKQPSSSNKQIANMDYSDYVSLRRESRIT